MARQCGTIYISRNLRGVAQLVARSVRDAEVVRSSRITPTSVCAFNHHYSIILTISEEGL